jgi:calcium-dependent protein kinase
MKQLLSVVFYCHSNNIVNRDYRLENILIHSVDYYNVDNMDVPLYNIRISDFKSARNFKNSKKLNKKVGNPYYIAPEVLKRKYNEKCDIWSCGIAMYILLTGKAPFSGNADKEVLEKVEHGVLEFFGKNVFNF